MRGEEDYKMAEREEIKVDTPKLNKFATKIIDLLHASRP
jgi:hypothetical protein